MTASPLTSAQRQLRSLRVQARRLGRLLVAVEEAEERGESVFSSLDQARLLLRLDRLAGKLDDLAEWTADTLSDVPQRR